MPSGNLVHTPHYPDESNSPGRPQRYAARLRVTAALFVLGIYTLPLGNLIDLWNPNEMSRLMLTVSMARYGTVRLDPALQDYNAAPQDMSIRDEHAYSDKAPGLSFLATPPTILLDATLPRYAASPSPDYWPLRHILTWLLICLPAALFPFFAMTDQRLAAENEPRYAYALLFAFATPVLTYASVFFSHVPAGLMAAIACLLVQRPIEPNSRLKSSHAFLAGLLAAFSIVTEYPTIILAVVVFMTLVFDRRRWSTVPAFLVGGVVGGIPLLIYNHAAWGTYFTTGYAFKSFAEHAAVHAQGFFGIRLPTWERLWGVLFSARRGLFFYCPLLLIVPVGWIRMWRTSRIDVGLSLFAVLAYITFATGFVDWEGGWCAADRHLVAILPLLFVPLAIGIRTLLERTWTCALLAALVGCSFSAAVLSVAVTPYFPELFTNPLPEVTLRSLRQGAALRNIISDHSSIAPMHVFIVYAIALTLAVGICLFKLARVKSRRILIVAVFLATLILHPTMLWFSAPKATPEKENARADLLERIGYTELAQTIQRESKSQSLTPRP